MKFKRSTRALIFLGLVTWFHSALVSAQSNSDCLACHSDKSLSMVKRGKTVSLFVDGSSFTRSGHGDLECVGCHVGFDPAEIPHARRIGSVDCTTCHGDEQFEQYRQSIHGRSKKEGGAGLTCATCHSAHTMRKFSGVAVGERHQYAVEICSECHQEVHDRFMQSDHGAAVAARNEGAPSCTDCHGEHQVVTAQTDSAQTARPHEADMCMKCHLDRPEVRAKMGPSGAFIASYEKSVHAQSMKSGNRAAASCSDCHGSHDMKKGSNPASLVSRSNMAATCGRCHADIQHQYVSSIHGAKLADGVNASATCTDCHGEHNILSPTDPRSPVAPRNVSAKVCTPCHASVRLSEKYGLAADRFRTFEDSFHGLAGKGGSVEVANCASCHGVHDIKPSSDSTSRIYKANLARTCGECHPGANENFAVGTVHVIATEADDRILYWVSTGYIILIASVIGGMAFHNLLDFIKKSRRQLLYRRGILQREHHGHRLYLRMALGERIQHAVLLVSFLTLVLTGFALRFPDAWWVKPIADLSPLMFEIRGIVHRVAGVVLLVAGVYHIYYLVAVPRGKQLLRDLVPVRQDLTDAIHVLKYNLGFMTTKPSFGRFSYIEKSEYWALVWGTVVMGITGLILWFDNTFLGILTKVGWDVARTVHYYEAWLATLAIIVWHFYFIMFNPDIYPINLAFWKGTLTEEEMAEEHPLELEEIKRKEAREAAATAEAVGRIRES